MVRVIALIVVLMVLLQPIVYGYSIREERTFQGKFLVYESKPLVLRSMYSEANDEVQLYGTRIALIKTSVCEVWMLKPVISSHVSSTPVNLWKVLSENTPSALAEQLVQPLITIISRAVAERLQGNIDDAYKLASTLLTVFANTSMYSVASEFASAIGDKKLNKTLILALANKLYSIVNDFSSWLATRILRYDETIPCTTAIYISGYSDVSNSSITVNRLRETGYYRIVSMLSLHYDVNKSIGTIDYSVMFYGNTSMDYIVGDESEYSTILTRIYSPRILVNTTIETDKVVATSGGTFSVSVLSSSAKVYEHEKGFTVTSSNMLSFKLTFTRISESSGSASGSPIVFDPLLLIVLVFAGIVGGVYFLKKKRKGEVGEEEEVEEEEEYESEEEEGYEE